MAFFSRFTERAQRALVAAQREAASLGRNYVGTEHLLIGVLTDPGAARPILGDITPDKAKQTVVELLGMGDTPAGSKAMSYTPRTKKVLELSAKEARDLKQNYIGTEHLLLALMREREGVAAHVLVKLGLDLNKAREELLRALGAGAEETIQPDGRIEPKETPMLDQYARDLNKASQAGELDPVIGRAQEIERIVQILSRRT
ncbi:MAG: ATP-dependent Clp protease ATP-binding subunit ClpC, partial [Clostridia bacterium]|nr:ATP-dependent Clp protease ATP-binding subunit ClpC [Clostridia bacterium]